MKYSTFESHAEEYFGFDKGQSAELAHILDSAGLNLEEWSVRSKDFWELASEFIDPFLEEAEPEQYALDPMFPGDEYLDADDEFELTAESVEGYGDE